MSKSIDLLALGNPCADIVINAERIPAWDDKCIGVAAGTFAGGTEANVACAASRLGLRAAAFGEVGDDAHGSFLTQAFADFDVDTRYLARRAQAASASTVILVSPQGERSIVWVPMPAGPPRADLAAALEASRIVYSMPYDPQGLARLRAAARGAGTLVAIDVEREGARQPGVLQQLLGSCDIAFLNESGFTTAMGVAPSPRALIELRAETGVALLVVTLGARGALAANAEGSAAHPAFPAEVLDATGAGDTFNAAFLRAHLNGRSLQGSLAFACAAASHSVAVVGARTGLPTSAMVEALLRAHPTPCS